MQNNSKYQNLIRGQFQQLIQAELTQFQTYVMEESILPEYLIKIATTLYRNNKEQSYHFLQFLADNVLQDNYKDEFYNKHKIRLYNYLTILALGKAARATQVEIAQYWLLVAKKYLIMAEAIEEILDYSTILNRAMICFYDGEILKAITLALKCEEVLEHQPNSRALMTSAFIVLAQCYFARRNYEKSLQYYKKCLLLNKCLPIDARLGMAYCYFNLNKFQMARACFQRILQLDPRCTAALVGLGIVYEKGEEYNLYLQHLKMAFQINSNQPLTLYLITEHFLVKNQLQKCDYYCKKGLNNLKSFSKLIKKGDYFRNDYNQLFRRFINIQGQIQHKKNNFVGALQHYQKIAQRQLLWNDISLMQCLIATQKYQQAFERMDYTYRIYEKQKKDSRYLKDTYRLMAYLKKKCGEVKDEVKNQIYYYNEAIKYDKNDIDLKCQLSYLLTRSDPHKARRIMQQVQKISQTNSTQVSPQLLINIGVLAIINHEPELGQMKLKKAMQMIAKWDDLNQIQQRGFLLIAKYNYGYCLENLNLKYQALQIYEQIIKENKFHLQSYLRKAYVLHKIGNYQDSFLVLAQAEKICQKQPYTHKFIEDIYALKIYLLYLEGRFEQSLQLLTPISQNKPQSIYYKILQFAIRYSSIIKLQNNHEKLLELFLQGKDYCQQICDKDNNAIFCFMMLITILASIRQLTKEQGIMAFKSISLNSNELPLIRYNTGLYYMCQDDEEAAISCFNQYRDYTQSNKANQLISYLYLINKDYKRSIKQIKKNILLNPSNIKYYAQLIYATQARCEDDYNSTNNKIWTIGSEEIKRCYKFHNSFNQGDFFKFNKGSNQMSQEIMLNLRKISQQKIISAQLLVEKFEKKKAQSSPKDYKSINTESQQSENQQDKIDRETERKRQMVLAKVKIEKDKLNQAWQLINQKKQKALQAEKLKRKPHKSKEIQELSAPSKKQLLLKQKKEEGGKKQTQEYYEVKKQKKQKQSLSKKQAIKEQEKCEQEDDLKKYLL